MFRPHRKARIVALPDHALENGSDVVVRLATAKCNRD